MRGAAAFELTFARACRTCVRACICAGIGGACVGGWGFATWLVHAAAIRDAAVCIARCYAKCVGVACKTCMTCRVATATNLARTAARDAQMRLANIASVALKCRATGLIRVAARAARIIQLAAAVHTELARRTVVAARAAAAARWNLALLVGRIALKA